jgi:hypothetical protein
MPTKHIDQFRDARRPMLEQMQRQHIPKLNSAKLVHERTAAQGYDID